ncbi:hypothetical protein [Streptosporangium sp. NPDC087985]|uniref:hypothetical protein n=1 Tax=Streptosporangium sp. NPDC087985 TaxID=3366196 RepID=UPI00382BE53F
MITTDEMPIVFEEDGMTIRCLETGNGKHWAVTRKPNASAEAIARALEHAPNPTGFRMNFPINGELTYKFFCLN